MLQDRLGLVLLDGLRHHVEDVVHHCCAELKVIVRLDTLLGNSLCNAFAVSAFELTSQKIA